MIVTLCSELGVDAIRRLLAPFGIEVAQVPVDAEIPGSYWGEPEAGLIGHRLYLRPDTPVHSALHEACHFVCLDAERRERLHTDAGGEVAEENAVCYLQVLLADSLAGYDRNRLLADMDAWGYSFRLGSARAWFGRDAEDARAWLLREGLIDADGQPTWTVRRAPLVPIMAHPRIPGEPSCQNPRERSAP